MDDFEALLQQISQSRSSDGQLFPPGGETLSYYNQFLEALRTGRHPPFCELVWNGEVFYTTLQIHFQKAPILIKPPGPEVEPYRQEAYRRFKGVKAAQQKLITIRVTIKNWLPLTAEVSTRPEMAGLLRLGTAQLMAFQNP